MDIGEMLGCGAVMGELVRSRSGQFDIENSHSLDEIKAAAENDRLHELILPAAKILPYEHATLSMRGIARALNGNPVPAELISSENPIAIHEMCWLFTQEKNRRLIGLFSRRSEKTFGPKVMF
jgi:tRNA U55 pseudouridine synthase TruB